VAAEAFPMTALCLLADNLFGRFQPGDAVWSFALVRAGETFDLLLWGDAVELWSPAATGRRLSKLLVQTTLPRPHKTEG
jgi:hypothetical protein